MKRAQRTELNHTRRKDTQSKYRGLKRVGAMILVSTTALCGPALAGSLDDAVVDVPVTAPPPAPLAQIGDWTGFYTGLQLGYGDADGPEDLDGNNELYGFHAGYDYDLGNWVIGGELD